MHDKHHCVAWLSENEMHFVICRSPRRILLLRRKISIQMCRAFHLLHRIISFVKKTSLLCVNVSVSPLAFCAAGSSYTVCNDLCFVSFHFVCCFLWNGQNICSIDNPIGQNKWAVLRFVVHLRQSPHISFRGKHICLSYSFHFSCISFDLLLHRVNYVNYSKFYTRFVISRVKEPVQNWCKTMQLHAFARFFTQILWFLKVETKADSLFDTLSCTWMRMDLSRNYLN